MRPSISNGISQLKIAPHGQHWNKYIPIDHIPFSLFSSHTGEDSMKKVIYYSV